MHDMLRIMDVASTLRRQRETAEGQLDIATAKVRLRERLLATAQAAGEKVTLEEVDAAIEQYFRSQHRYEDPPGGWRRVVANLWVMRGKVLALLLSLALAVVVILLATGAFSPAAKQRTPALPPAVAGSGPGSSGPGSNPASGAPSGRAGDGGGNVAALAAAFGRFEAAANSAAAMASDEEAKQAVQQARDRGVQANLAADAARLGQAQQALDELIRRIDEEYVVTIVSRPGHKTAVERLTGGRVSGYYLLVEALTPDGRTLPRKITSAEDRKTSVVSVWGEQVPEAVWQRVGVDKQADGIVDDAVFARKQRGRISETMVILDADQRILRRGRQILQW